MTSSAPGWDVNDACEVVPMPSPSTWIGTGSWAVKSKADWSCQRTMLDPDDPGDPDDPDDPGDRMTRASRRRRG